jgi:hypothetical protein
LNSRAAADEVTRKVGASEMDNHTSAKAPCWKTWPNAAIDPAAARLASDKMLVAAVKAPQAGSYSHAQPSRDRPLPLALVVVA